jgi:DNA (cytosine-5)-methyltransferase 1
MAAVANDKRGATSVKSLKIDYPAISLFSGAMGLDIGFSRVGFNTQVCVEIDHDSVTTIKTNRPEIAVVDIDITDVAGTELRRLSKVKRGENPVIIGGPPCQAFSVIGRRRGTQDSRGQLMFEFARVIDEIRPPIFVMENVRGLLSMAATPSSVGAKGEPGSLLSSLIHKFEASGYRVDCFVVNAVNYGAPQLRERLILIGNRYGMVADYPSPTHSNRPQDGLKLFATLGDVIGPGFVDPCPEMMDFSPRKLKYLAMIPEGGNWRSMPEAMQRESMGKTWHLKGGRSAYWRRLSFAFPSPTIVTMPNHASTSMCHPTEVRAITVGEAAAIQEFPREWEFSGTAQSKFRQVGNAVPIRLGTVTGEVVAQMLNALPSRRPKKVEPSRIVHLRPHVRTRSYWKAGVAISGESDYYN